MEQSQRDFSAQTDLIATTGLAQVSLLENSHPNLTLELTASLPSGNLSKKKKKEALLILIIWENVVFCMGVKSTVITVRYGLRIMLRVANTMSICTTLAYLAKTKMKKCLLK